MTDTPKQVVRRAVEAVTAPRTFLFSDPDTERLLDMVISLAGELAVTRERLDTVERLLINKAVLAPADVEEFEVTDEIANERLTVHDEMIARILRVVHQHIHELEAKAAQK